MTARGPIVLAAGGTGGHVFPAQALAEALSARGARLALFTDARGGAWGGALGAAETRRIAAAGLGGGALGKARGLALLGLGALQARARLGRLRPAAVVGFGGYPSVPTMLAAAQAGLPTLIHEQNAVLGRANRLLAPRVRRIATAFAETAGVRAADMPKVVPTGNPVRAAIAALRAAPYPAPATGGTLSLLVLGGSQGARVFSDVLPEALARLPEESRARLRLVQQCRPEDLERVRAALDALGVAAELAPFFADMPERLAAAQLVICRAGASTVAELGAAGRPAILVPYPAATDDHQSANARAFEEAGGGWIVPQPSFTPEVLSLRLEAALGVPEMLARAAAKACAAGRVDAAERLAEAVLALAGAGDNGAGQAAAVGERAA